MNYNHTQVGYLMLYVSLALIIYFAYILTLTGFEPPIIIILIAVILIILSFSTLNIKIDKNFLKIKFGYGIFSKKIKLKDIKSVYEVKAVKNHWYFGWGIRIWFWPYMIIYNVSGFDAVEIRTKNNKIYRIGANEPKKLEHAILESIKNA